MVYDGRVIYDHDAFGRVVQIREVLKEITFGADGSIAMPGDADTGRLIAHYSYDALGRVIRTQRPVGSAAGSTGERLAITDLYYDGVRVIQEAGWASVPGLPVPVTPGGTAYLPRPARHIAGDGDPPSSRSPAARARAARRQHRRSGGTGPTAACSASTSGTPIRGRMSTTALPNWSTPKRTPGTASMMPATTPRRRCSTRWRITTQPSSR
jgi:hypothetical protein